MALHIGEKIKQRLEAIGMSKSEFSRRINTSPQNVYGIFKRQSIDTDLLRQISDVLDFNFFSYYVPDTGGVLDPDESRKYRRMKAGSESPVSEVEWLKAELEQARTEISYLKRINELMEQQLKGA